MKRIAILFAATLISATALAQEKKAEPQYNEVREFRNRIFEVHNRSPRDIYSAIRMLGSGFKGSAIDFNEDLHTITVRDFPENIAEIEQAIQRLDRPAAAVPDVELKVSVLIASKTPLPSASIPEDLAPVVKQLQSTLRYSHYGLMTANVHRTKPGQGIEGSGVAEPTLLGMTAQEGKPIFYSYHLRRVTVHDSSVGVENFNFSMRIPLNLSGGTQYQSVGFETPVSVHQNEKVVIGTTTMGEKALIVVLTASVQK